MDDAWSRRRALILFGLSATMASWLYMAADCMQAPKPQVDSQESPIDRETPLHEEVDAVRALPHDLVDN